MVRFVDGQVVYGPAVASGSRTFSFTLSALLSLPGSQTAIIHVDEQAADTFILRLADWLVAVAMNGRGS